FLELQRLTRSTLFPYTTLFRSAKLDEVFEMPPKFDHSYYGFTIHEIREMQIVNMGNYAHGNQPIQHMIYLYNYANQPYKAQEKRSEEHTSELQSRENLVCRLLL